MAQGTQGNNNNGNQMSANQRFITGVLAGGTSVLFLHPLDLLKTRFQATTSAQYTKPFSILTQLSRIHANRGWHALYRGFPVNLLGSTMAWGTYFTIYHEVQKVAGRSLAWYEYFGASVFAGSLTVLIINPIWLAKTRICQPSSVHSRLFDVWRDVYRVDGAKGLWRGTIPGLFGCVHGGLQFMTYEKLKHSLASVPPNDSSSINMSTIKLLTASSLSKIFASLLTYPYQVIRCRLQLSNQNAHKSIKKIIMDTFAGEGIGGFYKGAMTGVIRVLPGTCITFLIYERLGAYFVNKATKL